MKSKYNLTEGGILQKLLLVALPVMGSQALQMLYNLTDMFWLGRLGADAIAASGTAGMYMWLSVGFLIIGRMGASIGVSQGLGRNDPEDAQRYTQNSVFISLALGVFYGFLLAIFRRPFIAFFTIPDAYVTQNAELYLLIVAFGMPLSFLTSIFDAAFASSGNARTPFLINIIGLCVNMVLDPLFIFTFRGGVAGAAIATVIGQLVTFSAMLIAIHRSRHRPFARFHLITRPSVTHLTQILRWGIPVGLESMFFTAMGMVTTRFTSVFGTGALAASRVGSQVESMTWLLGGGFGSALTAFMGQNYGAGKHDRIRHGFRLSALVMTGYGLFVTAIMIWGGRALISLFISEAEYIPLGVAFLRITALCQIPQCLEAVAASVFKGTGRTVPPSIVSIVSNALRVLLAWILASTALGVYGVWLGISLAAVIRGCWVFIWYLLSARSALRGITPTQYLTDQTS